MRAFVIDLVQIWILASSGRKSGHFKETKLLLSFITFNTYNIKQNAHIKTLEQECKFPCLITFTASDTVTTAGELFELHLDVAPHGHEEVLDVVPGKVRVQSLLVLPVLNLDKSIRAKYS